MFGEMHGRIVIKIIGIDARRFTWRSTCDGGERRKRKVMATARERPC
jgi:hypothetical protein